MFITTHSITKKAAILHSEEVVDMEPSYDLAD